MIRTITAALAVLAATASATPAAAQAFDGRYTATIRCGAFPGTEIGALTQQMSLQVAGTTLTGERNVGTATQVGAGGTVEKWTGTVSPDGTISATSNSAATRAPIQGSFTGRATRESLELRGTQTYTAARGGARSERSCTIAAKR